MEFTENERFAAVRLRTYLWGHLENNLVGVGIRKHCYFKDTTQLIVYLKKPVSFEIPKEWEGIQVWVEITGEFIPA